MHGTAPHAVTIPAAHAAAVAAVVRDDGSRRLSAALARCVDLNKPLTPTGHTLVSLAAQLGRARALRTLLAANRDVVDALSARGGPAIGAVTPPRTKAARVEHSRPPHRRGRPPPEIMRLVVAHGLVDLAIARGQLLADPDAGPNSASALWLACAHGHRECAAMLLDAGADPNRTAGSSEDGATVDGRSPLFVAVEAGDVGIATLLLDRGASVDLAKPANGRTPLIVACETPPERAAPGRAALVDVLIARGADVSRAMQGGWSPLYVAAEHGQLAAVAKLLAAGADVTQRDTLNETALHVAAEHGHADVVRVLVEHGADLDARTVSGLTPAALAATNGHLGTLRLLVALRLAEHEHAPDGALQLHAAVRHERRQRRLDERERRLIEPNRNVTVALG